MSRISKAIMTNDEEEEEERIPLSIVVQVTCCKKCKYDEFEEIELMNTPMLKCDRCGYEMVDEFKVYGRID